MKTSEHIQEEVSKAINQKLTAQIIGLEKELVKLKGQLEEMSCKLTEVRNESENNRVAAEKFQGLYLGLKKEYEFEWWRDSDPSLLKNMNEDQEV
jgi:hypothetical protein